MLRRLSGLPPQTGAPEFGLAVCDASGALLRRRRLAAFSVPRFTAGCPQLPLYRAFGRPLAPEAAALELANGTVLDTWSVSQAAGVDGSGRPKMEATMLYRARAPGGAVKPAAVDTCEVCDGAVCGPWRGLGRAG